MDELSELARALAEVERYMHWTLDQFDARLAMLESGKPAARYSLAEGVAARRRVVVKLRESGLSIPQIAAAIGSATATVERDLDAVPHRAPARVLGLDQKTYPSSKGNGRVEA